MKALLYRLLGWTKWRHATRGTEFVWRRFNADTGAWEYRDLTEDERKEAIWYSSIR